MSRICKTAHFNYFSNEKQGMCHAIIDFNMVEIQSQPDQNSNIP